MDNILELMGVNKKFNGFDLVDINFELKKGFIMGLIGPNGAGKTTTIKLILNMLEKDSGGIKVFGLDNDQCEGEIKERIGIVMDQSFYVDEWRITDVETSVSPFYRRWDSGKFKALLTEFGLEPKKKVKDLSRGMKMKLMIAAALSHDAELLILDEPTSGLDAVARNDLMELLGDFISNGNKSVLISTHITTDLEKSADYITFINNGRILFTGTKDDMMERYCVIKGGTGVLDSELKKRVFGYREHSVGFDGLVETSLIRSLPRSIVAEPASLDEIVVRLNPSRL